MTVFEFVMNNYATIITGAATAAVIGAAAGRLIGNKKKGRSSCGGCGSCGSCGEGCGGK